MSALKEEVQAMIANLPDDCTMEDIQYHLYVIEKIQNGMQDIENNKTVSHKEAKKKMSKWL
jgi:predicted transcriptional regulator